MVPDANFGFQNTNFLYLITHMSGKEEINTIQQLRMGDEKAYERVYQLYHKRLYGFALKYLKSHELSEDAVHDTFIKLWDHRSKLETNIRGFLFATLRNHVMNMIRNNKRKVLKQIHLNYRKSTSSNQTEDVILFSEYQKIFADGLDQLPAGKKEIFKLKTVQGLSNKEIADKLDISIHTVKSQYYEASRFIRNYLDEHAGIKERERESG